MLANCVPAFFRDLLTFRFMYLKNLLRRKRWLRNVIFLVAILIMYIFGVFTHIFEKDFTEFKTELKIGVRETLETLGSNPNIELVDDINNLNYTFIHTPKDFCKPVGIYAGNTQVVSQPYLIILIKSKISHFKQRDVIRNTWGKSDKLKLIRTVFLIGSLDFTSFSDGFTKEEKHNFMDKLNFENHRHNDIVQQEFIDNYYNNTLKTMMGNVLCISFIFVIIQIMYFLYSQIIGIKWINRYCINSKYFLFIDDDFYLNPNQLMKFLKDEISTEVYNDGLYGGFVFPDSSPMRHYISKWYISLDEYPYHKFPPFVAAGCCILSRSSARLFYLGSRMIKKFRFDDVYMAILAKTIGIKARHYERINYYAPTYDPTLYATEVIAAHDFNVQQLNEIWKELQSLIEFNSLANYKSYLDESFI